MGSAHRHGRKVKIMRSGRHTQPSQVEKVAEKAGKAAPVMAISAGALVAVPHGHAVAPAKHGTVAEAVTTAKTQSESGVSAVQAIAIAKVAHADATGLNAVTTSYQAKHAKPVQNSASQAHVAHLAHLNHLNHSAGHTSASSSSSHSSSASTVSEVSHSAPVTSHGSYSCSSLESLWEEAGGSSGTAFMAAEIAMAESGGNPNAESPTDDFGLWQINGSHGSMATLDPLGNARAAVSISGGGSSWGAWTTYTTGAYSGRC